MFWRDVNAPDTAWRPGSEDPIPVMLGRLPATAFAYRFATGRPLDGHARTDATFWRAGTKSFTKSGRTAAYNYWPGWKRGLLMTRLPAFGLLPYTAITAANERLEWVHPWWLHWEGPALAWVPLLAFGGHKGYRYAQNYQHERHYLRPIRNAVYGTLRTRDSVFVDIPRGLVHGRDLDATGRIFLPGTHPLHEGDRDNLLTAVRERLGHEALDARWNMEGVRPHMELFTPPQPPRIIDWDTMLQFADSETPYLGHSAHGPVSWDLGQDSPHIVIGGGSGSGKSELLAWVVSQFMRGGAGVVVLDPKYTSHRWLSRVPEVLYCREPQMVQDTVLWLDAELRRRGNLSARASDAGQPEPVFARLVVVLEERNSLQTVLRDHWLATRPTGAPLRAPSLAALDRLASMGRSFGINVILAAQEVTKADIGSRNNFGAFALAGRLPIGAWRLCGGAGTKKPAMGTKPGRFGYMVAGNAVVFQAAYPNLVVETERLIAFATSGDDLLDVKAMMQQYETPSFPSWEAVASQDATEEYVTLGDWQAQDHIDISLAALHSARQRGGRDWPDSQGRRGAAHLYRRDDLDEWYAQRTEGAGE